MIEATNRADSDSSQEPGAKVTETQVFGLSFSIFFSDVLAGKKKNDLQSVDPSLCRGCLSATQLGRC